jgi:hypothetical protein
MHAAGGEAPKRNRNALKHGACSDEALALKKEIQALARVARQTMSAIEWRILAGHDRQQWGIAVVR